MGHAGLGLRPTGPLKRESSPLPELPLLANYSPYDLAQLFPEILLCMVPSLEKHETSWIHWLMNLHMKAPTMVYPGHFPKVRRFYVSGFFSVMNRRVGGGVYDPFPLWTCMINPCNYSGSPAYSTGINSIVFSSKYQYSFCVTSLTVHLQNHRSGTAFFMRFHCGNGIEDVKIGPNLERRTRKTSEVVYMSMHRYEHGACAQLFSRF